MPALHKILSRLRIPGRCAVVLVKCQSPGARRARQTEGCQSFARAEPLLQAATPAPCGIRRPVGPGEAPLPLPREDCSPGSEVHAQCPPKTWTTVRTILRVVPASR